MPASLGGTGPHPFQSETWTQEKAKWRGWRQPLSSLDIRSFFQSAWSTTKLGHSLDIGNGLERCQELAEEHDLTIVARQLEAGCSKLTARPGTDTRDRLRDWAPPLFDQ